MLRSVLLLGGLTAVLASPAPAQLGSIDFPTTANSQEAQQRFIAGVLLLHSFEYEDARETFRSAQELEPDFVMAVWGEALTHYYPIWRRENPEKAQAALAKLGATPAERAAKCEDDLERRWLHAVEILFGDGTRNDRWTGYSDELGAMSRRYPHDAEIGAFHSLSVLGTSFGGRDTRIYMRAAGIAQPFYRKHPDHPGLLHYLIHCYDDPIHAPLGLEMARRYDKVAPDAAHALHMPSHIYVALGMWKESIDANIRSFAAGDKRRRRKSLNIDSRNWHAAQWLHYSHLQLGHVEEAEAGLKVILADLDWYDSRKVRAHVVMMRTAHLIETGDWNGELADFDVDLAVLSKPRIASEHFVRAARSIARGNLDAAKASYQTVVALSPLEIELLPTGGAATCCAPSGERPETRDDQIGARVVAYQIEAMLALAEKRPDDAVKAFEEACRFEDAMGLDFGPPSVSKPAHEMYGEYLLKQGKLQAAVEQFEAALVRAPGRRRSLEGLKNAHAAMGHGAGGHGSPDHGDHR